MSRSRWDETWHRLREWTNGQGPSERLAAQVLAAEGYSSIDPSHPLGGRDGGKDAVCWKDGKKWVMAVYFPRGQKSFAEIKRKFEDDLKGVRANGAHGIAFVTNQEISRGERDALSALTGPEEVDIFHLDRLTGVLDRPEMVGVRAQFLGIDNGEATVMKLGGDGGNAPSAGGGGGAAIGEGARGGDGGRGGNYRFVGRPAIAPGAGGGGIGAVGKNARGSEGGEGGERVVGVFGPGDLPQGVPIKIKVGRGGRSGLGEDGEDTTFGDFVRAKGGRAGRSAMSHPSARAASAEDIEKGLRISSIFLAEVVHFKNGLVDLLSAGWEHWTANAFPTDIQWPLACTVDFGDVDAGTVIDFSAIVFDPTGNEVERQDFIASRGDGAVSMPNCSVALRFTASAEGIWIIRIASGSAQLGRLAIEIRLAKK
jgi:hypothetical protein